MLEDWGLVARRDGKIVIFSNLLADFVQRQASIQQEIPSGVWVDEDAGDVWIEREPVPPLTELEFKLLALLHRRLDKVTDKYEIVTTVWGVDYIDEVDDARIEKLVSRLRSKIEPDPGEPRYIITVRGRGYKLSS
jgi:DNA-binding response OmpR family regulator